MAGCDLFSIADDALANDAGYQAFIAETQSKQRAVIDAEFQRLEQAEALWQRYSSAMAEIGLHPLTWLEIGDRRHELRQMAESVQETHGDTECNRYLYLDRLREARGK